MNSIVLLSSPHCARFSSAKQSSNLCSFNFSMIRRCAPSEHPSSYSNPQIKARLLSQTGRNSNIDTKFSYHLLQLEICVYLSPPFISKSRPYPHGSTKNSPNEIICWIFKMVLLELWEKTHYNLLYAASSSAFSTDINSFLKTYIPGAQTHKVKRSLIKIEN